MRIRFPDNQYRGVNAHLHSKFQNPGESPSMWPSFHAVHIALLSISLNRVLPNDYQAVAEQSLQIQAVEERARPRPDITVFDEAGRTPGVSDRVVLAPTLTMTLAEALYQPEEMPAVLIYHHPTVSPHSEHGQPVARVELLSPSNKLRQGLRWPYINNRRVALESGLVLVEIDYLHQSDSPIRGIPPYPESSASFPYSITISDPRLPQDAKSVFVYGFAVNELIPTLTIPLLGSDSVTLDFGAVYHETFRDGRWGNRVDYAEEPHRFDTYSLADQQRIRERITTLEATRNNPPN